MELVPETTSTPSTYDPALGALLVVPMLGDGGAGDLVALLGPLLPLEASIGDTAGLGRRIGDGRIDLFSRAGRVGERRVRMDDVISVEPSACPAWPVGRLGAPAADSAGTVPPMPVSRWQVGLPAGRATGVVLDSIEALPARDSAALAATLTRLTSALPDDSTGSFHGLPFTVTRAYRTRGVDEGFLLGVLVRRIPQEDRPLEERLLVLVRTVGEPRQWAIVWHERVSGREEEVIATEPLAVVLVGTPAHPVVLLGRDDGSGTSLALLERRGDRWRIRWESPVAGC